MGNKTKIKILCLILWKFCCTPVPDLSTMSKKYTQNGLCINFE